MMLFLTLFALGSIFACSSAETFIVYGEDSDIMVLSSAGKEIKKFVIFSLSEIKGIAIHYEEDLIFAVDGEKITKIHLLDDEGNRKISGKGELFLDKKVSHFEFILLVLIKEGIQPRPFSGEGVSLAVDTNTHKLYIGGLMYVYEMNYNGTNVRRVIGTNFPSSSSFYFNNFLFHKNKAFVEVYSSPDRKFNGIYETAINPIEMKNLTNASLILGNKDIYSLASDNRSKSIFIVEQWPYQISAIQTEEKDDLAPLKQPRILLSNYGVTLEPKALAVNGRTVAWCSHRNRKLFVGKMNKNKNFLPLKDIVPIPGSVKTYQIVVFETNSGQSFVVSSKYRLVIMITFVNAALNLA